MFYRIKQKNVQSCYHVVSGNFLISAITTFVNCGHLKKKLLLPDLKKW